MNVHSLKRLQKKRGVAALEFALILPILIVLIFGIWEVGRIVGVVQVMSNACREAGRQASTGIMTADQIKQVAINYLAENDIVTTAANITVGNSTTPTNTDFRSATQLDNLAVSVSVPIENVRWLSSGFFNFTGNLTTTGQWKSMNDIPLEVPSDLPVE